MPEKTAAAFNEWMRRFIEEPLRFKREFEDVCEYLSNVSDGQEPSYGAECVAYLESIISELDC